MRKSNVYIAKRGEIDLRGFEIARIQFFNFAAVRSVTFSIKAIRFSIECIRTLMCTEYIKMMIHPMKKSLAVKVCNKEDKQYVQWANIINEKTYTRGVSCAAYIQTLYELFNWSPENKYRFRGYCTHDSDGEKILRFDLQEPEIITTDDILYPEEWHRSFGTNYYCVKNSSKYIGYDDYLASQYVYNIEPNIHPTEIYALNININNLIDKMNKPEYIDGTTVL